MTCRKNYIYLLPVLVLISWTALLLGSCAADREEKTSVDDGRSFSERLSVYDARLFFDELRPLLWQGRGQATRNIDISGYEPYLCWDNAVYSSFSGYDFIEVPFFGTYFYILPSLEEGTDPSPEVDISYMNTAVRLMCGLDSYGEIYYYLAYITPSAGYMAENGLRLDELTMSCVDKDFSGSLRFFSIEGGLLWGYAIDSGNVEGLIFNDSYGHPQLGSETRAMSCTIENILIYYNCYGPAVIDKDGNIKYVGEHTCYIADIEVEYYCHQIENDTGVIPPGGAPGPGTPSAPPAPKAVKLMKSTTLTTTQWQQLEVLVEKILQDCLGRAMYGRLEGSGSLMEIQVDPSKKNGGSYTPDGNLITLGGLDGNFDARLFHESWHGMQDVSGEDMSLPSINLELEAHVAQYIYWRRQPESEDRNHPMYIYYDNNIIGRNVKKLGDMFELNGTFASEVFTYDKLNSMMDGIAKVLMKNGYENYIYDASKQGLANLNNLQQLIINCL